MTGRHHPPRSAAARALKAVVAGAMASVTAIALGAFLLYRIGGDRLADSLLSDRFPLAFVVLAAILAVLFHRRFDR